jgi:hypothetical protein
VALKKRIRIIKKIRENAGVWNFISLKRIGNRYVWDKRPGYFFIEWWDGKKRKREKAGQTPSEAVEAQRWKQNELIGELLSNGKELSKPQEVTATSIQGAIGHVHRSRPHPLARQAEDPPALPKGLGALRAASRQKEIY